MIPVVLLLENEKIGRLANLNKNSKKKAKLANLQNKQTNKTKEIQCLMAAHPISVYSSATFWGDWETREGGEKLVRIFFNLAVLRP